MKNKFTVIGSTNEDKMKEINRINRIIKRNRIWGRQYCSSIQKACTVWGNGINAIPQETLSKIGLSGVKYICSICDAESENEKSGVPQGGTVEGAQVKAKILEGLFAVLGCLTLRNFVTTFPIEKYYKGAKWEEKDYFYTMDVLKKMDWDKPIGRDGLMDLLWDYENTDLRNVYLEFLNAMSAIYRSQTGKGLAEQWCEDQGIDTYTYDRETGIMIDNQTGDIIKAKEHSHLRVVNR